MLDRRACRRAATIVSWLTLAVTLFLSRSASAYPWMIRHEYQGCVPCHADPSGAGLLTEYGRAMGENVLRTRYGSKPPDELPVYAKSFFGVPTPDWLLIGGSLRGGVQLIATPGSPNPTTASPPSTVAGPFTVTPLVMEADLKAQVTVSRFRAYASLGYSYQGAQPAQVTDNQGNNNLVSREHWIGVDLGDDKQFLLRAGRIDLPFGIKIDEHDLLVRNDATTATNFNDAQEYGAAFYYGGEKVRFEVMGIAGNYLVNPDALRRRGYSGYVEFNVAPRTAFGVSSMVTYQAYDPYSTLTHEIKNVHGIFTRYSPVEPLVLFAETDAFILTSTDTGTIPGFIGMVQADVEPTQGLHLIATAEGMFQGDVPTGPGTTTLSKSWDGGFALLWFFAPHADVRVDFLGVSLNNASPYIYLLPQLHVYL